MQVFRNENILQGELTSLNDDVRKNFICKHKNVRGDHKQSRAM